ncbi:MAG: GNAT family N-acetyltransferase [bacterium]
MIHYLTHSQIDKARWDDCIGRSLNRRVYAFSWYLDIVCPGWDALVEEDYRCVFPLTQYRKWGISYLAQPYFAQQLGIFSGEVIPEDRVVEFIGAIPRKYRFTEIHLNSENRFTGGPDETTFRVNHVLGISSSSLEMTGNYAQNTRRNIRKAEESGIGISRIADVDLLIDLFRENFGRKEGKLKAVHYATLRQLLLHCIGGNRGYILGANSKTGSLSAAAFFLFDNSRVYYLFAASAPEARENGAMFLLIDRFIAENTGKGLTLDFEGGNDPNLGRFYKSFGAVEEPYATLKIDRLLPLTRRAVNFVRRLRK